MHHYSDLQHDVVGESSQVSLSALRQALLAVQASLRRCSDLDLQQVIALIEDLPCPYRIALYLQQEQNFYRVLHPDSQKENSYLLQYPVPGTLFAQLQRYQCSSEQAYLIPISDVQDCIPTLLPSLEADSAHPLSRQNTHRIVLIPLIAQIAPLGFLALDGLTAWASPVLDETIDLFVLFAQQLADRLEQAQLRHDLHYAHEELRVLSAIRHSVLAPEASKDLQSVYQTIYTQLKDLMPIDFFAIERYDPRLHNVIQDFKVASGEVMALPEDRSLPAPFLKFLKGEHSAFFMFSSLDEWKQLHRHSPISELLDYARNHLQFPAGRIPLSGIIIAIKYAGEPVGIFAILSYQEHSYTHQHLRVLTGISDQIAIAIKNASMYSELRQALKVAQESEQLKDQFLMTASHELRTPLTAVQGYLELLNTFHDTLPEETQQQFLINAHRACEELVLLLGNIMDASRIDQDKVEMTLRPVRLIDPVHTIIEIMEPQIIREGRTVEVHVSDDLYVMADDLRLRQILLNLVGNAFKYASASRRIAIRAESLSHKQLVQRFPAAQQTLPADQWYVVVAVRDWGPGIAPQEQQRLFKKFMRLKRDINSTERGAGLGLYLCRQLIEAMQGFIWIESSGISGEGATFFAALPQCQQQSD